MTEDQRRTEVLKAEEAVRLLAKSLAGADTSKKEFDDLTAILSAAVGSITEATTTLGYLRPLIATEHDQATAAIASTVTQAQASLEEATKRLTQLGGQAVTVAAEQASSAARRMRELEENVDKATGRLDTRVDKVGQMVTALQKDLGEQLSKIASSIHTNVTDSSKRVLDAARLGEESVRKQAVASASELTQRLTTSQARIENVVREQTAASTSEIRKAVDTGVQLLLQRLAQAQQEIRSGAEAEHKRSRTLLFRMYFVEGAVVLGIVLLLWRHW
jgi:uncharacterized protein Yka (UPF0111/DUF47 family)